MDEKPEINDEELEAEIIEDEITEEDLEKTLEEAPLLEEKEQEITELKSKIDELETKIKELSEVKPPEIDQKMIEEHIIEFLKSARDQPSTRKGEVPEEHEEKFEKPEPQKPLTAEKFGELIKELPEEEQSKVFAGFLRRSIPHLKD